MVRVRLLLYLGVAFLFVLVMAAFTSESFSLNTLLHPVPRSPPVKKTFIEGMCDCCFLAVAFCLMFGINYEMSSSR